MNNMKGFRTLSALLLSFAMLSCADNLKEGQSAGDSVSVKAEIVATKVVLGEDSGETTEIFWQDGDQISVTVGEKSFTFDRTDGNDVSKSATFTYADTDFPERTEPTTYEFQYPAEGKAALAEQEGTKEDLRKYHFMTAEVLANDEYPLGARALKFNTQVAIVKLSLNNEDFKGQVVKDVALAVNGEPAYVATEEFVGSEDAGEVVVYLAVEPGSLSGCKVVAVCGGKTYEAALSNNTLEAGNLYRVNKEVASGTSGEGGNEGGEEGGEGGDDPVQDGYTDLSAGNKTANCYIVSAAGNYKFQAVKGNTTDPLTVTSVQVLWESFGTTIAPQVGDLVKLPEYKDGYVYFTATQNKGNAVIAAKNGETIVWSWHIWMTDSPAEQTFPKSVMMDRNLGALNNTPGTAGAFGLLYQWGRKDPFLAAGDMNKTQAVSTITWPAKVSSDANKGTVEYAVNNPTVFIKKRSADKNWLSTDDSGLWDEDKTIYDPCPAGWSVPEDFDVKNSSWTWNATNFGLASGNIWIPASGIISDGGNFWYSTTRGYYWVANGKYWYFTGTSSMYSGSTDHSYAGSIRCEKE